MIKEFVLYKIALELKELGFDEPCFAVYEDKKWQLAEVQNSISYELCLKTGAFPAPLYQQAFRWFREKEYDFNIVKELSNDLVTRVYVYWCGYLGIGIDRSEEYETYEEAELACLVKLIEIVKEKQ